MYHEMGSSCSTPAFWTLDAFCYFSFEVVRVFHCNSFWGAFQVWRLMGTSSNLSVCVLNADAFGKLLVEGGVSVLKGFQLAQYDKLNGNSNFFKASELLVRRGQKSFYSCLVVWCPEVYLLSFRSSRNLCLHLGAEGALWEEKQTRDVFVFESMSGMVVRAKLWPQKIFKNSPSVCPSPGFTSCC